jgi:hypothetical protein
MYNNKKREYTSPEMEILNTRVERGFEGSTTTDDAFTNPTGNDRYAMGEGIGHRFS